MNKFKLVVTPLLSLGFLVSCGSKDMEASAEEFKKEINKTYDINFIKEKYIDKSVIIKGKLDDQGSIINTKVKSIEEENKILFIHYENFITIPGGVLSPTYIDNIAPLFKGSVKFYIFDSSYTCSYSDIVVHEGLIASAAITWNRDCVLTELIQKTTFEGKTENHGMTFDYIC